MFLIGFPTPLDDDVLTVAIATAPAGVDVDEEFCVRLGDADSRSLLLWSLRSKSGVGATIDLARSFSTNNAGDDDADTTAVPGRFRKKLKTRCVGFKLAVFVGDVGVEVVVAIVPFVGKIGLGLAVRTCEDNKC